MTNEFHNYKKEVEEVSPLEHYLVVLKHLANLVWTVTELLSLPVALAIGACYLFTLAVETMKGGNFLYGGLLLLVAAGAISNIIQIYTGREDK